MVGRRRRTAARDMVWRWRNMDPAAALACAAAGSGSGNPFHLLLAGAFLGGATIVWFSSPPPPPAALPPAAPAPAASAPGPGVGAWAVQASGLHAAVLAWEVPEGIAAVLRDSRARGEAEVRLHNAGAVPGRAVAPAGLGREGFLLEGACPVVLEPGEACVLSLVFTPREVREIRGILTAGTERRVLRGTAGPLPVRPGRASVSGGEFVEDGCAGREPAAQGTAVASSGSRRGRAAVGRPDRAGGFGGAGGPSPSLPIPDGVVRR